MDPDETLKALRGLVSSVLEHSPGATDDQVAYELAHGFDSLDEWITGGGFLPRGWQR